MCLSSLFEYGRTLETAYLFISTRNYTRRQLSFLFREPPSLGSPVQSPPEQDRPDFCLKLINRLQGVFSGKPLRSFFRFGHQDASFPPSPRVGEGGWEKRSKSACECRKLLISPKNSALESLSPWVRKRLGGEEQELTGMQKTAYLSQNSTQREEGQGTQERRNANRQIA